jgi:shikimate kinase
MSERPVRRHLVLIGMMGTGKTTLGRAVAARLRRPFHDSDEEILAATKMTVPQIFHELGEEAFRAEERAVLARALSSPVPSVVAAAGGSVIEPDSRRRIEKARLVVWLRASPATLARRLGTGEGRPLLDTDPAGTLARLDAVRRPLYRSLANAIVDVDHTEPLVAAERIYRLALSRTACSP